MRIHTVPLITLTLLATTTVTAIADNRDRKDSVREEPRAMMKDESSIPNTIVNNSTTVYKNLLKGPHGSVPENVLSKAKCVVVVPSAITAAAVVGGTHGDGVSSCRLSDGKWSAPAFVDLNKASFGTQIGAKSSDLVLYLMSANSVDALKRGEIKLGADASVVAGKFERSTDANVGVIAYQREEGAFIGASLSGGSISLDEETNQIYYGKSYTAKTLLEDKDVANKLNANAFTALLPS